MVGGVANFFSRGHLAMCGNVFSCCDWGAVLSLVGRGQGCYSTSYNIEDTPTENCLAQNVKSAKAEKLWVK